MSQTHDTFPDAEAFVTWALRDAAITDLDGVHTSMPKQPAATVAIVGRIGGIPVERHRLDSPSIQVDVYAPTQSVAHDVAAECRAALMRLEGGAFGIGMDDCPVPIVVTLVEDSLGLSFIPDPTTSKDRYIFGVRLVTHAIGTQS